jgi:hypothetical protein
MPLLANGNGGKMQVDTMRTIQYRRSPIRVIALALGSLGATLALIFVWPMVPFVTPGSFHQFLGWTGALLFGAYFLSFASALLDMSQPVVTIAPEGFRDRRIAPEVIAWSSVEKLSVWDSPGTTVAFVVTISDAEWRRLSVTLKARWDRFSARLVRLDGLWVVTNDLNVKFDDIFQLVAAYTRAHGGKVD